MERTDKRYYRCNIQHEYFYNKYKLAYVKHCEPKMLQMLLHIFSRHTNESLNHDVATLAPKWNDYLQSASLKTRAVLVAAAQTIGYYKLWKRLFAISNLKINENLARHLKRKDENEIVSTHQRIQVCFQHRLLYKICGCISITTEGNKDRSEV